jgi:hypothetical protein
VKVFVASSSLDSTKLEEMRRVLRDARSGRWQALEVVARDPNWMLKAREYIALADAVLFVTSMHSIASPNCKWELSTALSMGKPCFQWIVDTVEGAHPASQLPVVKSGDALDAHLWTFADKL